MRSRRGFLRQQGRAAELAHKVFLAKQRRRRQLARLPIDQKIVILCRLQAMASEVQAAVRHGKHRPWKMA